MHRTFITKLNSSKALVAALLATAPMACNLDREPAEPELGPGYSFEGYVYDGVTGERVSGYSLTVSYSDTELTAEVTPEGKYFVASVPSHVDYTVVIEANGYRPFFAGELRRPRMPSNEDQYQAELWEAFVFPENVTAPETTLRFLSADTGNSLSGSIQLTPAGDDGTSLLSLDGRVDGAVSGQVWMNDADRKFSTVVQDFEDGTLVLEEGALVYGVTYQAIVHSAEGHQFDSFFVTAGTIGNQTVVLEPLSNPSLQLVSNSANDAIPSENAELVLTFNQPIQLHPARTDRFYAEAVDDGFSIPFIDPDGDGDFNTLVFSTDEPDASERGTELSVEGNRLTLRWARAAENFESQDADDPIPTATYDISSILVQPVGDPDQEPVSLSSLVGMSSITVKVDADPAL